MAKEDIEKTQSQPASSDATPIEAQASAKTDAPSTPVYEIEVESSDDSAQNDKSQKDTVEKPNQEATPAAGDGNADEGKQRNIQAELGKMSALEKERNERVKELEIERKNKAELERKLKEVETEAQGFQALTGRFRDNPTFYENFRKMWSESTGQTLPEHAQVYGSFTQQTLNQPVDLAAIKEEVKQELRQDMRQDAEASTGFQSFVSKYPEMDPTKLSQEESLSAGEKFAQMRALVPGLQTIYPQASVAELLEYAYNTLPDVRERESQRTKEANELSGMAKAYSKGIAGSDGMSGGAGQGVGPTIKVKLTAAEKSHYDKLTASNPRVAKLYLQKIAERS